MDSATASLSLRGAALCACATPETKQHNVAVIRTSVIGNEAGPSSGQHTAGRFRAGNLTKLGACRFAGERRANLLRAGRTVLQRFLEVVRVFLDAFRRQQ